MWRAENRRRYERPGLCHPSDLADGEWELIAPLIPPAKRGGRRRTVNECEVVNGLLYVLADRRQVDVIVGLAQALGEPGDVGAAMPAGFGPALGHPVGCLRHRAGRARAVPLLPRFRLARWALALPSARRRQAVVVRVFGGWPRFASRSSMRRSSASFSSEQLRKGRPSHGHDESYLGPSRNILLASQSNRHRAATRRLPRPSRPSHPREQLPSAEGSALPPGFVAHPRKSPAGLGHTAWMPRPSPVRSTDVTADRSDRRS